jgi:hypothetical protein
MTTLTFNDRAFAPAAKARPSTARAAPAAAQRAWLKPMALGAGETVRVVRGRGLVLRAAIGSVWATEEGLAADFVLGPGETHRITSDGVTLIEAQRPSRIVLEAIVGQEPPVAIERVPAREPDAPAPDARGDMAPSVRWLGALAHGFAAGTAAVARAIVDALRLTPASRAVQRIAVGGWEDHDRLISSRRVRGDRGYIDAYARADHHYPYY